ncbi:ArsR/SmtB family transcription factor [Streptomyces agglomeratus]|uniref:ArsR/SmtB family transcription factor n=1 Tax=Streptomyces agglomeratus TaxID=285458 RepID=UPI003F7393FE
MPVRHREVRSAGGRELEHPAREEIRLESVLQALADPARLQVVRVLAALDEEGLASCSAAAAGLGVSKSTSTHHFRVLRVAGVIRQHYRGTAKMNTLRRADLEARFPGLLVAVVGAAEPGRRPGPA